MKITSCAPAELIGAKATSPSHSELRSEVNACGRADFDESCVSSFPSVSANSMHFALHLCLMNSSFPSVIARQQHAHRSPLVSQINSSFPSVIVNNIHIALRLCLPTVRFHQLQPKTCTPLSACASDEQFVSISYSQQHAHRSPRVLQMNSSFPSVIVNSMHTTLHLNSSFPSVTANSMHTALHLCLR